MQGFAIRQNILSMQYGWESVFLLCRIPMAQNGNGSFVRLLRKDTSWGWKKGTVVGMMQGIRLVRGWKESEVFDN